MDIKVPSTWMNQELDTSTIQNEVKTNAHDICERRKSNANDLEARKIIISNERASINSLLNNAQNALSKQNINSDDFKLFLRIISELDSLYAKYEKEVSDLASRFKKSKIRIVAFGKKSQGKSSFIREFTRLPKDVIETKEHGDDKDKTGCTCIYHHKENCSPENPEIKVVFRTTTEILNTINHCLKGISDTGFRIDGRNCFTWDELVGILNSSDKKKKIYDEIDLLTQGDCSIDSFGANKSILKSFFDPQSDYSDICGSINSDFFDKEKGKTIEKTDLPMYNDMQFMGPKKYQIVSEIHIFVDLKRNNMLENIEICDTKGMSIEAGGSSWEEEIYKEIGNSDAAFSIQMSGGSNAGGAATSFYEKLNDEIKRHKDLLKDMGLKHYILINPFDGGIPTDAENDAKIIATYKKAQAIYIGALVDKLKYGNIELDLHKFVDYFVYDMIRKIVITTNQTDKTLLDELDKTKEDIKKKYTDLIKILSVINKEIPEETLNWNDVVINALRKRKVELKEKIEQEAKKHKITLPGIKETIEEVNNISKQNHTVSYDDDDDESEFYNSVSDGSSYGEDISTDVNEPDEYTVSKGVYNMLTHNVLRENVDNNKAIELAIGYLFDQCLKLTGKEGRFLKYGIVGTSQNIGSFIDDLAAHIYSEVNQNINHYFIADSDNSDSTNFNTKLFNIVWEELCIGEFLSNKTFDAQTLYQLNQENGETSVTIRKMYDWYNKMTCDNKAQSLYPRTSFSILKNYFDAITDFPSEDQLRSDRTIIDSKLLREAVVNSYKFHDYATRYKEQLNNDIKNKRSVLTVIVSDMDERNFEYDLLEMYKLLKPQEYSQILLDSGVISSGDKDKFDNQVSIKIFRETKSQIDSFKTAL